MKWPGLPVCCMLLAAMIPRVSSQLNCKIDLVIAVDASGSITANNQRENWDVVIEFVQQIVDQFMTPGNDIRVATMSFGNIVRSFTTLTDVKADVVQSVVDLGAAYRYIGEFTNTSGALDLTITTFDGQGGAAGGDRADVPDVLLMITDGVPTRGFDGKISSDASSAVYRAIQTEVLDLTQRLKDQGVINIMIGVTDNINATMLQEMARSPSEFFTTPDFNSLEVILQNIVDATCSAPVVSTTAAPPVGPCREEADIYFILDSSGSIGEENFKAVKEFTASVILELPVGSGTRVGVIRFSTAGENDFFLNAYTSAAAAANAVREVPYMRQRSNIADSLRFIRTNGFTQSNGDRSLASNIVVVFTDGNDNEQAISTLPEAYAAKREGIHIIVIGLTNWRNVYNLQSIASDPYSANYIQVDRPTELNTVASYRNNLKALLCNDVNECQPNPCSCASGQTCIDKIGSFSCSCNGQCAGETCTSTCSRRVTLVIVIDASSNMNTTHFRKELDFLREVVMGVNIAQGDRVGFVVFSDSATTVFSPTEYTNLDSVLNAMTMEFPGGSTNTAAGLTAAKNILDSTTGDNKVILVLTDGSSMSYTDTWTQAKAIHDAGIDVLVVGIRQRMRMKELMAMASGSYESNLIIVDSVDNLPGVVTQTRNAICNNDADCESVLCQNNGVPRDYMGYCECECPAPSNSNPGFYGPQCQYMGNGAVDIVFLVDSSGSIRRQRYKDILNFLGELVSSFGMSSSGTRFGAVYFSNSATKAFDLNTYTSEDDVILALAELIYLGRQTNIVAGLNLIRSQQMFSTSNGGRASAQKFVILISDGVSNINREQTIPTAIQFREEVAQIICFGIGLDANTLELKGIASEPVENMYFTADSFNDITSSVSLKNGFLRDLVTAPVDAIDNCDGVSCGSGQCLDLLHRYMCVCPQATGGRNCERSCNVQRDLALILDFSSSLDEVFDIVIQFAKEIIYELPIGSDVRLAVIDYDNTARLKFNLNAYLETNKMSIINAMSFGKRGTTTNTAAALDLSRTSVFSGSGGDRGGVPNGAILVTDGLSTDQDAAQLAATRARDAGIEIFVVAYGNYFMEQVNGLASDPDSGHTFIIGDNQNLVRTAARQLASALCA